MPEGDTIFRAARTLHKALAGKTVRRFESVFPQLTNVDIDTPLSGRTIEHVEAIGKHLLIRFDGGLTLRTHMRMNGSWHIYRPGEKWLKGRNAMRIVIATDDFEAVGFRIPEAEFIRGSIESRATARLGPDLLARDVDLEEVVRRLRARPRLEIADALLDQTISAGIGNVFKSEVLFVCRVSPFARVGEIDDDKLRELMATAQKQLAMNVIDSPDVPDTRTTTGRANPSHRLWVYGREKLPCRRCATPIERVAQGPNARLTYWCPRCQGR